MDDVLCFSADPEKDLQKIADVLKCSDLLPVNMQAQRHVGMEITSDGKSFFFDMNGYIADIPDYESEIDSLGPEYALKSLSPFNNLPLYTDDAEIQPNAPFPYTHVNLFQQVMGTLGWLALCHPGVAARHGELATHAHKPTPRAFRVVKGVLQELRKNGLDPLEMVAVSDLEVRLWIDCAVHHHSGRRGWVLQFADSNWPLTDRRNMVAWRSVRDKMKHASSTSGEVNAVQQGLEDTEDIFYLLSKIEPRATARLLSDSMSGILQIANGGHSIRDKERAQYIRYLLQAIPFPHKGINHVSGLIQMADPLTKVKE